MYELTVDCERHRIEARIHGFIDAQELVRLVNDIRFLARSLRAHGGAHDLLCDLSDTMVGSQAASRALNLMINDESYRHLRARRIAFHTPSALMQMQMGRVIVGREGAGVFADRAAAEEWLAMREAAPFNVVAGAPAVPAPQAVAP